MAGKGLWQGQEGNFCMAITAMITVNTAGEFCVKSQAPEKLNSQNLSPDLTDHPEHAGKQQISLILISRIR